MLFVETGVWESETGAEAGAGTSNKESKLLLIGGNVPLVEDEEDAKVSKLPNGFALTADVALEALIISSNGVLIFESKPALVIVEGAGILLTLAKLKGSLE